MNPWTGSAVNAHVAKIVLESELGTPVELVEIDENATWPGMAAGDIDAVLEVWPSGHAEDRATYIDEQAVRRRHRPARPDGEDRLVRAARSSSRSTPSWRRGRASRIPSWPACSPPPRRATTASS